MSTLFDDHVGRALAGAADVDVPLLPAIEKEILHHDIIRTLHERGYLSRLVFFGGTNLRLCHGSRTPSRCDSRTSCASMSARRPLSAIASRGESRRCRHEKAEPRSSPNSPAFFPRVFSPRPATRAFETTSSSPFERPAPYSCAVWKAASTPRDGSCNARPRAAPLYVLA
jgi:hypothetical protein